MRKEVREQRKREGGDEQRKNERKRKEGRKEGTVPVEMGSI